MSYQVIARKYRPQTFDEVVGQKPIVTTLINAVEQQRLHHAYLFSGPRGVGKTTVARLLAKAINCATGPTAHPCNACASCLEIAQSRSMDVLEIDGASNRGIENIRELRETVRYSPARDRHKIFIIDEVHMLTDPAWNALLKTLEEPPPRVVFVFATTEYREIPVTILSRCQHFEFRKVAPGELLTHLAHVAQGEGVTVEPSALDLIGRVAEGSLRDALSALDQVIAFSGSKVTDEQARTILGVIDREMIVDFYAAVRDHDCARLLSIVETLFEKGYQPVEFLEDLMAYGRDLLVARTVADPRRFLALGAAEIDALTARAAGFSEDELLRLLEILTREEGRIKNSTHPRFLLEALGIRLARLADLQPIEELLARLEEDAGGDPPAPGRDPLGPRGTKAPGSTSAGPGAPGPAGPAPAGPASSGPGPTGPRPAGPRAVAPPPAPRRDATATEGNAQAFVEKLLRAVHEERGAVGAFLEQAVWIQATEDTLQIVFSESQAFFRDKVQSREVSDYLRRVARTLSGRDLRIQVETGMPGSYDAIGTGASNPLRVADPPDVTPVAAAAGPAVPPAPARTPSRAASPRSTGGAPADPARRALFDQAMQEPAVRTLLDALGGELVDVEPA